MATKTIKSREMRNRFHSLIDTVVAGDELVVERYNSPAVVMIGYAQWKATLQQLKRLQELELLYEIRRVRKGIATGEINTISHDELKRQLLESTHVGA
jgi:prevent-host-death family protein